MSEISGVSCRSVNGAPSHRWTQRQEDVPSFRYPRDRVLYGQPIYEVAVVTRGGGPTRVGPPGRVDLLVDPVSDLRRDDPLSYH